jgi:predicted transcriptional regulator
MGCTHSLKKQESEVTGRKLNENGFKNLFYATTEFDLSTSDSENEDELLSIKSLNDYNKQKLTKKFNEISSGLSSANNNPSTMSNSTLLDNRLNQTSV